MRLVGCLIGILALIAIIYVVTHLTEVWAWFGHLFGS